MGACVKLNLRVWSWPLIIMSHNFEIRLFSGNTAIIFWKCDMFCPNSQYQQVISQTCNICPWCWIIKSSFVIHAGISANSIGWATFCVIPVKCPPGTEILLILRLSRDTILGVCHLCSWDSYRDLTLGIFDYSANVNIIKRMLYSELSII